MLYMLANHEYDAIIIGSSPLMLIQAIELSRSGKSICILDIGEKFGGLWQNLIIENGEEVECGIHLLEHFPSVYETLEEFSGVEFAPLQPQPVRTEVNGVTRKYASRLSIISTFIISSLRFFYLRTKNTLSYSFSEYDLDKMVSNRLKIVDFVNFLHKNLLKGTLIQAPVNGYVDFTNKLIENCKKSGCKSLSDRVVSVRKASDKWLVEVKDNHIFASSIYCSASALLTQQSECFFTSISGKKLTAHHLVIEVGHNQTTAPLSYHYFVSNPDIVRISRLDYPDKSISKTKYLIQLTARFDMNNEKQIKKIEKQLVLIGLVKSFELSMCIYYFSSKYQSYSILEQLPEGEIAKNFFVLSSAGNLASGIAHWLVKTKRHKKILGV